jgi:CDP-glycerol glycerophosphotransferase (TagB/SpsB family)/glycosyltransferase involved in cell wall biosynthesis
MARLTRLARTAGHVIRDERRIRARRAPIDESTVLYESFAGNGVLCNPEAIFRTLLAAPDLHHLQHVWALSDPDRYAGAIAEFAGDPRVRFVKRGSDRYYAALSRAKYLVNNATFPEPFGKRPGQIYLNTWHGTPIKAMGYDVPDGALDTRNVVRNLVAADYLLAPNPDTERMYLDGYRMRNIFRGRIIAGGTPRIDHQFADGRRRAQVRTRLRKQGIDVADGDRIVLYAPTWKGDFYTPANDVAQLCAIVEAMTAGLDRPDCRVLLKVHQRVYEQARSDPRLRGVLVPNDLPTNELLSVTDVLITDYSSIFVDFLVTDRPVLFYVPDLDDYTSARGLYLPVDRWPGPVCRDLDDLVKQLGRIGSSDPDDPSIAYVERHAAARERYCQREDGDATARVVDVVFRGADPDVRDDFADGRRSLLIHLGGMVPNGLTASALSLLDAIDHDRFDVSVSFPYVATPQRLALMTRINPLVRLFPQPAGTSASKIRMKLLVAANTCLPGRPRLLRTAYAELFRQEWRRSFGDSRFDHVVDFSGYAPYWTKLLTGRTCGSLSIMLHNDMCAELTNAGRDRRLRANLKAAMAFYRAADALVSVSESLHEVNRTRLAGWAPESRFTHARNTVSAARVLRLAQDGALPARPGVRTFVTAGRLSPEKNHERLVRAFAQLHEGEAAIRLVVLGAGPLLDSLRALVDELRLADAVTLAGHQDNPFPAMAAADCFVLSSDYEGQPMVLLEALVIGLPIVSTAFGSVRDALPAGTGLVVARDVDALADGMRAFLRGEVPNPPFDHVAYNRLATEEFYRAIGAPGLVR